MKGIIYVCIVCFSVSCTPVTPVDAAVGKIRLYGQNTAFTPVILKVWPRPSRDSGNVSFGAYP